MSRPNRRPPPTDAPLRVRDRLLLALLSLLTWTFERMPIDRALALGAGLGRAWVRLGAPRTRRVRGQLAFAMPEVEGERREAWTREVFVHLGTGLAELILLRGRRSAELLERVRVEGLQNIEAARRHTPAGGALIVTAHHGNWELGCAKVASLGIPLSVVYRGRAQPVLDRALLALRAGATRGGADGEPPIVESIPMGRAGLRVVRALEAGRLVVVLMDQDARREEGVFVRFFGHLASTRSGPVTLATRRGVPVLPVFMRRDPDARGHCLQIQPALQLESGSSDDEEALRRDVQRVTAVMEREIRASPGQWIWTHRRWRTQPLPSDRRPSVD